MLYLRHFHAPSSIVKLRIDFHQNSWKIPPPKKKTIENIFSQKVEYACMKYEKEWKNLHFDVQNQSSI